MPRDQRIKILMDWHRRVGLVMVIILMVVISTGVMMNHTDHLHLNDIKLTQPGLLGWYGLENKTAISGYAVSEKNWIATLDNQLYLNQQAIADCPETLFGALNFRNLLLALCADTLHLLTDDGSLLETITPAHGLPPETAGIGQKLNHLFLQTDAGVQIFDLDTLTLSTAEKSEVEWPVAENLPTEIASSMNSAHITLEKLVQDIHSGRILGGLGIWLVDLSALLLLILTVTGLWSWLRHRKLHQKTQGQSD